MHHHRNTTSNKIIGGLALGLLAAAIVREFRIPTEDRTWQGRILGFPYDLRFPTTTRLRAAYWNPANPTLFTTKPGGVGWGLNLARLSGAGTRRAQPAG